MLKRIYVKLAVILAATLLSSSAFAYSNTPPIDPGYNNDIIDDVIFQNSSSMSVTNIQNFLNSKVPNCDVNHQGGDPNQPPPYVCLRDYVDPTTGKKAAQLIYDEATSIGLNPQVILVTLQKEQGLVTDTWPYPSQYKSAMGYGCPESATVCESTYYGFYNQVHLGARLLRAGQARDCGDNATLSGWSINSKWAVGNSPTVDGVATYLKSCATGSLFNYTPHRPDSAYTLRNGAYYYGNYNFVNYFNSWFGSTLSTSAIKGGSSGAVYLYVNGYKVLVPTMALLQDYGFSPQSIQTYSQAYIDSLPVPDSSTSISPQISTAIKSTNGDATVWLVSEGQKYIVSSMSQLSDYNISSASIAYLPPNTINALSGTSVLSNFIHTPSSNAFQVSAGSKRIIFDYSTYSNMNPSGQNTPISDGIAGTLTSGTPISNRDILVRKGDGAVALLLNGTYYTIPSMAVYDCWGFDNAQGTPMYQPADGYISTITGQSLGCTVSGNSSSYLVNRSNKFSLASDSGITGPAANTDLNTLANRLPSAASSLSLVVKSPSSSAIWYLEGGKRKAVTSMSNFGLLGYRVSDLSLLDDSAMSTIPVEGIKLGQGQAVRTLSSGAVYAISGNGRVLYASADDFMAYRNTWGSVETYDASILDAYYPYASITVGKYLYDSNSQSVYIVGIGGCYKMTDALLTDYSQTASNISSKQGFSSNIFPSLPLGSCNQGSKYAQIVGQETVYYIDKGTKYPFSSWNSLVQKAGTSNPPISHVDSTIISGFPVGAAY